jgi:hypothetical protein
LTKKKKKRKEKRKKEKKISEPPATSSENKHQHGEDGQTEGREVTLSHSGLHMAGWSCRPPAQLFPQLGPPPQVPLA